MTAKKRTQGQQIADAVAAEVRRWRDDSEWLANAIAEEERKRDPLPPDVAEWVRQEVRKRWHRELTDGARHASRHTRQPRGHQAGDTVVSRDVFVRYRAEHSGATSQEQAEHFGVHERVIRNYERRWHLPRAPHMRTKL